MIFDSHTHLNAEQFNEDIPETIQRAQEMGVTKMAVVGFEHPFACGAHLSRDDHQEDLLSVDLVTPFGERIQTVGFQVVEHLAETGVGSGPSAGFIGARFYNNRLRNRLRIRFSGRCTAFGHTVAGDEQDGCRQERGSEYE